MTARSFHPSVLLLKSASPGEVILSHSDGDLHFLASLPWFGQEFQLASQPARTDKFEIIYIVFLSFKVCRSITLLAVAGRWILDCSKYAFDGEDKDLNHVLIGRTYLGCHRGCHLVVVTSQWSRHQQFLTLNLSDSLSNLSGGRNSVRPD